MNKLGYQYTDIKKWVFFDGHEQPDVIKYCGQFFKKLEILSLYLVEFYKNGFIEPKIYLSDCAVNGPNKRPVIFITYNKSTFLANDN